MGGRGAHKAQNGRSAGVCFARDQMRRIFAPQRAHVYALPPLMLFRCLGKKMARERLPHVTRQGTGSNDAHLVPQRPDSPSLLGTLHVLPCSVSACRSSPRAESPLARRPPGRRGARLSSAPRGARRGQAPTASRWRRRRPTTSSAQSPATSSTSARSSAPTMRRRVVVRRPPAGLRLR